MGFSNTLLTISLLTLLSAVYCHNHHNHHQDDNWISFLPVLEHILKNQTTPMSMDNKFDSQEKYSTVTQTTDEVFNSTNSTTPVLMNGYESYSSGRGFYIGVPIGGIILIFVCCYCCCKCCGNLCKDDVTVQSTFVQAYPPPPPNPGPTHIVVQQMLPPPMPQQQYPPGYEMGPPPQQQYNQFQPQQQQWNQQQPVNQQFQHAPPPPHYYPDSGQHSPGYGDATAPPQYGKY